MSLNNLLLRDIFILGLFMFKSKFISFFVLSFLLFGSNVNANVSIFGTRVVYDANSGITNVEVENKGDNPSLIQAWITNENNEKNTPFVISPPVSRIEPNTRQTIRIRYIGNDDLLNKNMETLFYFNLFDIPPKPSSSELTKNPNYLQFAINSRLKLFFRPKLLPYSITEAYKKVEWNISGNKIQINNNTPYYITYSKFQLFRELIIFMQKMLIWYLLFQKLLFT